MSLLLGIFSNYKLDKPESLIEICTVGDMYLCIVRGDRVRRSILYIKVYIINRQLLFFSQNDPKRDLTGSVQLKLQVFEKDAPLLKQQTYWRVTTESTNVLLLIVNSHKKTVEKKKGTN